MPFYLDWKVFTVVILGGFYVQKFLLGGCVLSLAQFDRDQVVDGREGFITYYLRRLGFRFEVEHLHIILTYIVPALLFLLAFFWQVVLGREVLLF